MGAIEQFQFLVDFAVALTDAGKLEKAKEVLGMAEQVRKAAGIEIELAEDHMHTPSQWLTRTVVPRG